jgi:glutamate synthase domain-containing protein 3
MSFREEFMRDLPSDPSVALATLADRAQDWLNLPDDSPNVHVERVYVETILRTFITRYAPEIMQLDEDSDPTITEYIQAIVRYTGEREVQNLLDDYEAQRESKVEGFGYARLDNEEKETLRAHLQKIREIVDRSNIGDRKKTALFERINRLQDEVDKDGSRTDRFFAFAGDSAFVVGEMAENAKPFLKEVKDILKLVTRARAKEEGVALPGKEETLFLPTASEETGESGE